MSTSQGNSARLAKLKLLLRANPKVKYENISEIEPGLFLGGISPYEEQNFYTDKNMGEILKHLMVDVVISVYSSTPDGFPKRKNVIGVKQYMIIILDEPEAKIYKYFNKVADIINKYRNQGKRVFIHCHAGISRSASLLTSYYMKHRNMSIEESIGYIQSRRPFVRPNDGFLLQLISYEKLLTDKNENTMRI